MRRAPNSMTGVGFAAGATEVGDLRIEVRAVNGKSLATKLRLPPSCNAYAAAIEDLLREQLRRGSVTVAIEVLDGGVALPSPEVLRALADRMHHLAGELRLAPPSLTELIGLANAAARAESSTSRPLPQRFAALCTEALRDLQRHRASEGVQTVAAIEEQLGTCERLVATAALRAPELVLRYRENLMQRVRELAEAQLGAPIPAFDLVREVAAFADRVDVAEELQRLGAHIAEFRRVLGEANEVGRRLEFLLQEMLRETNTLASKSPDTQQAHTAVALKTAIERMREQAANLE